MVEEFPSLAFGVDEVKEVMSRIVEVDIEHLAGGQLRVMGGFFVELDPGINMHPLVIVESAG